ncbi:conjugal transfer protein [Burkholderia vietnamiensis]|jgi:type IV pili sensor histidine kinase/response regulator|uniref:PFGI-1 class ICE element type IV pilus protein PilL2 n=1 Tax=Burkholderia cepacia complex TaxID=87882 RepID=UPI0007614F6F|nr:MULTISPECIES: PilL N-terminal domain-containing protein [Burkholderia cepacia complex]KVS36356.1 conjugal transfer protein [Burkholderia vietnamiensis]MBU9638070.1 PilL N-terminal domain-containing protein [Burkholderia multivorans]PRF02573.1 conjugal transfer protein [Burkholderia multivorans]PRG41632.1 conjugal transfer protein [Burkholderia multivorans]
MRPFPRIFRRYLAIQGVLAGSLLAAGCAIIPAPSTPLQVKNSTSAPAASSATSADEFPAWLIPVIRRGRYTLVEMVPDAGQRDLMQQVVDIAIPPTFDITVGDALRYVLLRSGYQLCDSTDAATLYGLPLPASQLHLGPLSLRDALLTLAGPAWDLSIDEANRQVCFGRHANPASVLPAKAIEPTESTASPPSSVDPVPFDDPLQPWEVQP